MTLTAYGIECDFEETGDISVAVAPHEQAWLTEEAELLRRFGHDVELLDGDAIRAEISSPTYLGGLWDRTRVGLLDPGKLAAGLGGAASALGVEIYERSQVRDLRRGGRRRRRSVHR